MLLVFIKHAMQVASTKKGKTVFGGDDIFLSTFFKG